MIKSNTAEPATTLCQKPGTSKSLLFRTVKELKELKFLVPHIIQLNYWQ